MAQWRDVKLGKVPTFLNVNNQSMCHLRESRPSNVRCAYDNSHYGISKSKLAARSEPCCYREMRNTKGKKLLLKKKKKKMKKLQ